MYTLGFASAVVSMLLGAGVWLFIESRHEPALIWGGVAYTSKQEFAGHLKSLGADYDTWALRHPGAAPWEPPPARPATVATVASVAPPPEPQRRGLFASGSKPLALDLVLATGCALVLAFAGGWLPASRRRTMSLAMAAGVRGSRANGP